MSSLNLRLTLLHKYSCKYCELSKWRTCVEEGSNSCYIGQFTRVFPWFFHVSMRLVQATNWKQLIFLLRKSKRVLSTKEPPKSTLELGETSWTLTDSATTLTLLKSTKSMSLFLHPLQGIGLLHKLGSWPAPNYTKGLLHVWAWWPLGIDWPCWWGLRSTLCP